MNKIKIAISYIFYPMAMGHWFLRALQRRNDVELWTVGPYTGNWIPWDGGIHVNGNYVVAPNYALPASSVNQMMNPKMLDPVMPWTPDLFLIIDAGWHFSSRPKGNIVAHIQTDPHVLKSRYLLPKIYSDVVFCMQTPYIEENEIYLPYGFDPTVYYPEELEKETDACLIGLHYAQRDKLVGAIRSQGYKVHYSIGEIFDENRIIYNKSRLALSWSSLFDLPARVWEGLGLSLPVLTNRLPDLDINGLKEGIHYLGFDNLIEATDKAIWALENYDDALAIGNNGYNFVKKNHTWDVRVEQILKQVNLL